MRLTDFAVERRAVIRHAVPVDLARITLLFAPHGGVPQDYLEVMADLGACEIKGPEEPDNFPAHLRLLPEPVSAIRTYYGDSRILQQGAAGDVLIVALDSTGAATGYDTEAGLRLVEVDNYRIVTPLPMALGAMVYGLVACWPDVPVAYRNGVWQTGDGRLYGPASKDMP